MLRASLQLPQGWLTTRAFLHRGPTRFARVSLPLFAQKSFKNGTDVGGAHTPCTWPATSCTANPLQVCARWRADLRCSLTARITATTVHHLRDLTLAAYLLHNCNAFNTAPGHALTQTHHVHAPSQQLHGHLDGVKMRRSSAAAMLCCALGMAASMTPIRVTNTWRKEVNVKIHGEGIGGCDMLLDKNTTDTQVHPQWIPPPTYTHSQHLHNRTHTPTHSSPHNLLATHSLELTPSRVVRSHQFSSRLVRASAARRRTRTLIHTRCTERFVKAEYSHHSPLFLH